jgi:ABC-type dipeptide/oligopeptide/nickel transport system permease component
MTRYIVRRFLFFIPVLFVIALITFVTMRTIPGGPFDFRGDKALPPTVVANLEAKYHLDDPLWKQFVDYLWGVVRLDFGPSYRQRGRTVNDIISGTLVTSAELGAVAMFFSILIGLPTGILAALKQNSLVDYVSTFIAVVGRSVPSIVMGPLLMWIFALQLGLFPTSGWGRPIQVVLPAVTLGAYFAAYIARLTRASLLQVVGEDYIRTARAKGLAERAVIVGHALKNSLIPVVTIMGPIFAAVLTGTFVVEQIFAIPGMGRHFVSSVNNRDYPVVMATTLVYAVAIALANLMVDVTYAFLDPRIRYD